VTSCLAACENRAAVLRQPDARDFSIASADRRAASAMGVVGSFLVGDTKIIRDRPGDGLGTRMSSTLQLHVACYTMKHPAV